MSRENVEVVRELLTEFASTHRAVKRLTSPDFVWNMATFRGWPDATEYVGPEGFDEFFAKWTGAYDAWDMDTPDFVDVGDDRVVVLMCQRARPRGADAWVELRFGAVYEVTDGLISRMDVYATREEALEAVGLRE